jgi:hypothetical protein
MVPALGLAPLTPIGFKRVIERIESEKPGCVRKQPQRRKMRMGTDRKLRDVKPNAAMVTNVLDASPQCSYLF